MHRQDLNPECVKANTELCRPKHRGGQGPRLDHATSCHAPHLMTTRLGTGWVAVVDLAGGIRRYGGMWGWPIQNNKQGTNPLQICSPMRTTAEQTSAGRQVYHSEVLLPAHLAVAPVWVGRLCAHKLNLYFAVTASSLRRRFRPDGFRTNTLLRAGC